MAKNVKVANMIEKMRRCKTITGLNRLVKGVELGRGKRRVYAEITSKFEQSVNSNKE